MTAISKHAKERNAKAFLARSDALRSLILAVEKIARENWSGEMDGDTWIAYEAARAAIGAPIVTFPGGNYDHHIHWLDHEEGACCWCDAEEEEAADGSNVPAS